MTVSSASTVCSSPDAAEKKAILLSAHRTIDKTIEGLHALDHVIDDSFVALIHLISSMKGRLIITGMGKSGHIARKIAATCASTGTPSYFVHPAEASHGDMGMIGNGDVIMMLSNSGETAELSEMIAYAKRFNIALVALVRRSKSLLVDVADIAIILPEVPEASVTGAPTTSTSMMLAYGDAMAVALLEYKGFTQEDFGRFHPGGKLGKGLMRVSELMHEGDALPIVNAQDSMKDVLVTMTSKAFGCAIVVNEVGELEGIVTDGDLRRHIHHNLLESRAREVMTKNPLTTTPQSLVAGVLNTLNSKNITSLVVTEAARPIGLIHIHDCLRAGVA